MKSTALAVVLFLAAPLGLAAQEAPIERARQAAAAGKYADAAEALGREARRAPSPDEEKALREVIEALRAFMARRPPSIEQREAAREALCLARHWFPDEEIFDPELVLRVGGAVQRPELIRKADPEMTEQARKARLQGVVILEAVIDEEGCVRRPRVLKGLPMGLDRAAIQAVETWVFRPAFLQGKPQAVYYALTVEFRQ